MSRLAMIREIAATGNLPTAAHNKLLQRSPRWLFRRPAPLRGNWSVRRINTLHAALPQMRNYLEIGLAKGRTFENVTLDHRVGVDPDPQFDTARLPPGTEVVVATSDAFFRANDDQFDLVFLDGLHEYKQTYRDLMNALRVCPQGAILIDDVVPSDEVSALQDQAVSLAERSRLGLEGDQWHGDVFRIVPCIAEHHHDLTWRTISEGGNEQLLVWKADAEAEVTPVRDDVLAGYATLSFSEVFAGGIPHSFIPASERTALQAAIDTIAPRYAAGTQDARSGHR